MADNTLQADLKEAFKAAMDAACTSGGGDPAESSTIHSAAGDQFGKDAVTAIEKYLKGLEVSLAINAVVDITGKTYKIPKQGEEITVGPWSGLKVKGTADGNILE